MTTKLYVGVDPSLTGLAIAFLRVTKSSAVPFASLEVEIVELTSKALSRRPTVQDRISRYEGLVEQVRETFAQQCVVGPTRKPTPPTLILVEGYAFAARHGTLYLSEMGGLLRQALLQIGPTVEAPPTTLKKFATGRGNAKKLEMVSALSNKYSRAFRTDNEADAFALAHLAALLGGARKPTNEDERHVVKALATGKTLTAAAKAIAKEEKEHAGT